ncbi:MULTISPECIES: helix-turn-helix domain-containing protein [unclassified Terribacillus]|uniref:helix-turn-helix domain-containing protein n=1 Tax=unclassified Terribacillus TaxID=2636508 RepID=UPI001C2B7894|nr:helix-turn-helix transcriptional regulator [Terribacillus sp. DMT04]QXE03623.1 helix-turn-helix domain-containing protein [Terribacillus sp. DMT04]
MEELEKALYKGLGIIVKQLRIQKGLSQEELGAMCGLHRTYVSDIERGRRNVSLLNIYRLSVALGVHMSELLRYRVLTDDKDL